MNDHLTEEEQLEAFKRWLKENGLWIVTAVVIAVGGYFGWNTYQDQKQATAEAGSALYTELLETLAVEEGSAVSDDDRARAAELVEQLKAEHAGSAYGANAALIRARWAVDQDDLDTAESELRWVLEQDAPAAITQLARLRLARVQSALGQLDEALATLDAATPADSIAAEYAEARGDILSKQGDNEGAAQAYQSALDSLDAQQQNRVMLLQMKLDNVQPATANDPSGTEENAS